MTVILHPNHLSDVLLHTQHDREVIRMAVQSPSLVNLLFYGPPGTGKTTLMRVSALEALRFRGLVVQDHKEAVAWGNVFELDHNTGFSKAALDKALSRMMLATLSSVDRRFVLLDEADSIDPRSVNNVKKWLDRMSERDVQVFAATNHLDRIDPAIRDRCLLIHMAAFSQAQMLLWLTKQVNAAGLPVPDEVRAVDMVNRSGGSMRNLRQELQLYAFQCGAPTTPPPRLTILPGGQV